MQSYLIEIIMKLQDIQRNTADEDTNIEIGGLIEFIEQSIE